MLRVQMLHRFSEPLSVELCPRPRACGIFASHRSCSPVSNADPFAWSTFSAMSQSVRPCIQQCIEHEMQFGMTHNLYTRTYARFSAQIVEYTRLLCP